MNEEENLYELLALYFSGGATPEQAIQVEDWRSASPENRQDFERCSHLFGWSEQLRGTGYAVTDRAKLSMLVSKTMHKSRWFLTYKSVTAAVFVCAILVGVGVYTYLKSAQVTVFSANVSTKKVHLESAEITLHQGATLTLSEDRKVKLKGHAEFSVQHSEIPFIVDIQDFHVKDLGTRFSINAPEGSDTVRVTVTEGKVTAYDDAGSNVIIAAGGQATYIRSQKKLTLLKQGTVPGIIQSQQQKPDGTPYPSVKLSPDSTGRKGKGRVQKKRVSVTDQTSRTKIPRTVDSRTKVSRTGN